MRIAIFSDTFYPELSGIADSIIDLGTTLSERGHDIDYYVPSYSIKNYRVAHKTKQTSLGEHITVTRYWSLPFPSPNKQARLVIPTGLRYLLIKNKPDVVHTQTIFGVGIEAWRTAKALRVPCVGTNHTALAEYVRGSWLTTIALRYERWFYNHCTLVTAPSASTLNEMVERGLRRPYRVISNPIATQLFTPSTALPISDHRPTIIYAGRLAPEKNVDVIIKAMAIVNNTIPKVRLVLAGHGNAEESLRALTRTLHLETTVEFIGTVDHSTLAQCYRESDAFVTMSTSETQGMTVLQAQACGLPAIGARSRSLPEYILPEVGRLVTPGDVAELAATMIDLLQNKELCGGLGRQARRQAEKFSSSNIADEWEKIYANAIAIHDEH